MTYRRMLYAVLAIGLIASLFLAAERLRYERHANRVEIVMDDQDFQALAQSYAYNQQAFLIELRRAGLTSLAVQEELGAQISSSAHAAFYSGATLLDQAQLSGLRDPVFARLAAQHALRADDVYVVAFDQPTAARYARQLPLKFSPHSVRRLSQGLPVVFAVRTQPDYFGTVALGLPLDRVALSKKLGLRLMPRLQNDEGFTARQIVPLLADTTRFHNARTVVFFGLRNEVLGYPDALDVTAATMKQLHLNFGTIETYDVKQMQAGNDGLAKDLPSNTVRVQAIARPELDKLRPEEEIQRYLLGVRERNVRVVYLRPFSHQWNGRSIESTNVEIVRQIAAGIRAAHMRVGTATPFQPMPNFLPLVVLASLAVPAIVLLILEAFGLGVPMWLAAAVAVDVLLFAAGTAVHHDMAVRKLFALCAAIAFPVAGFIAVAPMLRAAPAPSLGAQILDGLRTLGIALAVTLGGALVVVALASTALTMLEVDRFTGVKLVLAIPPLIVLALYLFSRRFDARVSPARLFGAPVTVLQLVLGIVIIGAGGLLLARSGNQSDIAPSSFELALRAHLTQLLQVRPRTKEFLFGFPALMLAPALLPVDRRRWGWLLALGAGVGLADVSDTFSHLHTALTVSAERVVNGAVLGAIVGAIAIALYRRLRAA